ncbi:MAG: PcfJ domain-containing protein [Clostridia bacterium]|nr:PcfJ domain-containing protein [Clostridia bacterium]
MATKKKPLDQEEVERVRQALPMRPTDADIEELQRRGYLKNELYLFEKDYVRNPITGEKKPAVKAYCTACGVNYWYTYVSGPNCCHGAYGSSEPYGFYLDDSIPEAKKDGDKFACPECGCLVTAKRKEKYNYSNEIHAETKEICKIQKIEGHLAAIKWRVYKQYTKEGKLILTYRREEASVVIDRHLCRYSGRGTYRDYYRRERWYTIQENKDRIDNVERGCVLFDHGVEIGTDSENCGISEFLMGIDKTMNCKPGAYMQIWCQRPNVENLAKAGLSKYLQACIDESYKITGYYERKTSYVRVTMLEEAIDLKRAKPHEMLGVEKPELELARDPMIKPECFDFYRRVKAEAGIRLTKDQLVFVGSLKLQDLNQMLFVGRNDFKPPVEKTINYLAKQVKLKGPHIITVHYLRDYWDAVYKVYGRMEPSMLWPSDLVRAHDSMNNRVKWKINEELKEGFKKRKKELAPLAFVSEELGLEIFPAGSEAELIREGDKLHHCVARYAKDHASGKTAILFIRRLADRKTPFYTLEWRDGRINQNHGDRNMPQTKEILAFEKLWLAHVASLNKKKGTQVNGTQDQPTRLAV